MQAPNSTGRDIEDFKTGRGNELRKTLITRIADRLDQGAIRYDSGGTAKRAVPVERISGNRLSRNRRHSQFQ